MNGWDVYVKTEAGSDELKTRASGLALRMRSVLIMVDGSRTVAQLQAAAASLAVPPDFLEVLERDGLIALLAPVAPPALVRVAAPGPTIPADATDAERFVSTQKYMIQAAVDGLGLRAFLFTLKLERCYTLDDLRALRAEFERSLSKARGEAHASAVLERVRILLN